MDRQHINRLVLIRFETIVSEHCNMSFVVLLVATNTIAIYLLGRHNINIGSIKVFLQKQSFFLQFCLVSQIKKCSFE